MGGDTARDFNRVIPWVLHAPRMFWPAIPDRTWLHSFCPGAPHSTAGVSLDSHRIAFDPDIGRGLRPMQAAKLFTATFFQLKE